ncbi:hypothetical protein EXIGLDRAFT_726302 [Exidia glandulosa HHB12029]|uniref:Uncharacterized protein n=1 Tax=Exidia glandulosa HHB12029 TaxID=1314781 RepID=A0A165ZRQ2_EXIGL|nr:hypothetical protein EXIGLDRAFT_726302 [Exidia glandulosa HHB12029]
MGLRNASLLHGRILEKAQGNIVCRLQYRSTFNCCSGTARIWSIAPSQTVPNRRLPQVTVTHYVTEARMGPANPTQRGTSTRSASYIKRRQEAKWIVVRL